MEKSVWTYNYVSAVSDEGRKKGRTAGSLVADQYLGKNEECQHVLASMNTNGTVSHRASCASPCRISDMSYGGNIAYSTQSSARPSRTQWGERSKWPTGPRMRSYRLGPPPPLRPHRWPSARRRPRALHPMGP